MSSGQRAISATRPRYRSRRASLALSAGIGANRHNTTWGPSHMITEQRSRAVSAAPQDDTVDLSVIVPVYNEAENLERLIAEIRDALDPTSYDYEIIAVDDGST